MAKPRIKRRSRSIAQNTSKGTNAADERDSLEPETRGDGQGVGDSSDLTSSSKDQNLKKKPRYWTEEEDKLLEAAVETIKKEENPKHAGDNMWKKVSAYVPNRAWRECLQRWTKVLVPGLKKGKWSPSEDDTLLALVNAQIKLNPQKICWPEVSKGMGYRSCKQCRERWINHLDPNVKKGDWTPEEDEILLRIGKQYPAKWAKIARHIPGRTENTVKVRWKILKRQEWKSEEDSELLRLTAMYPRQWRIIANKLPGRNERNVKQRLHVLSKEKPEAFSFLENLPSPKIHSKALIGKKRAAPGKDKIVTSAFTLAKTKRQNRNSKPDTDFQSVKKRPDFTESVELTKAADIAKLSSGNGLDILLKTAVRASGSKVGASNQTAKTMESGNPPSLAGLQQVKPGSLNTSQTGLPQTALQMPPSPTLNPLNPYGLMPNFYPFVLPLGAQGLAQAPMQPGMSLPPSMPFPYNTPASTMAYMATLSAQLNQFKSNTTSKSDTPGS